MDPRNEEFNSGEGGDGTGPYRLVSWEPKGDLVMERFEEYWVRGTAIGRPSSRKEDPPTTRAALRR